MAIRKKGKWKDRQHKPPERRVNGRTDNTMFHLPFFLMAFVLSVLPFTLLSDGLCCLSFHLPFFLLAVILSVLPFTRQHNGHQKEE
jgi:heme/copper-type cytochrome/quinol oxidase subunit 4